MTTYKNIPQGTDQRNQSQSDLLGNFQYLLNVSTTPVTGILPVDHLATGDNSGSPSDGFHNQVSYVKQNSQVASLVNAVNGQSSNLIEYALNDANSQAQINAYNGTNNFQITPCLPLRAAVNFNATGGIIGTAFNVTSVVLTTPGGINVFTITFTNALPSANYKFTVTGVSSATPGTLFGGPYTTTGITTTIFQVAFFNTSASQLPANASVMIFGG